MPRAVEAGAGRRGFGKVDAAQIGGAKMAVAKINACRIRSAHVEMVKVAIGELDGRVCVLARFELLDVAVAQELKQWIFVGKWFECHGRCLAG